MQPVKGLHSDFQFINQPENTLRYTLNTINDSADGGIGSVITEPGNELCVSLDTEIIGTIPIANDELAIFSVSDTYSEIGVLKNCNYTSLVKSNCLNFSKQYPIKGVARVKNCDRIVYWNDTFNNDRFLNLDKLLEFKDTDTNDWDCDKFDLLQSYLPFQVTNIEKETYGSTLEKGSYVFAFAYEDDDGNRTDFFSFTEAISIQNNQTINLFLSGIDTDFAFIRPVVIKFSTDNVTNTVYLLDTIPVSGDTYNYVFNFISGTITPLADINIPTSRFIKSEAMDIVSKRLVRGNLSEEIIDWTIFQEQVNIASASWIVKLEEIDSFSNTTTGSEQLIIDQKSLRRDEIYDIGIVYVFTNGTESPVFSIPGRDSASVATLVTTGNNNRDTRTITGTGNFDTNLVTVVANSVPVLSIDTIRQSDVEHLGLTVGDTVERWKLFNTAIKVKELNKDRGYWSFHGYFGYYESNQEYPSSFGSLAGEKVRYHRMPTLSLAPINMLYPVSPLYATELQNKTFIQHLGVEVQNIFVPLDYQDQILGYRVVYSKIETPTVVDTGLLERVTQLRANSFRAITPSVPFHLSEENNGSSNFGSGNDITDSFNNPLLPYYYQSFISPLSKFKDTPSATYLSPQMHLLDNNVTKYFISKTGETDLHNAYLAVLKGNDPFNSSSFRVIDSQKEIGINIVTTFKNETIINAGKQESSLIYTNYPPLYDTSGPFGFNNPTTGDTSVGYALTTLKRNVVPLSNRYATKFITFDSTIYKDQAIIVYGGDTYLVDFAFRKTQRELLENEFPQTPTLEFELKYTSSIIRFFTECSINTNYREEGTGFFTRSDGVLEPADLFYTGTLQANGFLSKEPEYRNYYSDVDKFSVNNFWKEHYVLNADYEFNEECSKYTNLIAYSEVSEDLDLADNFRIFRSNNLALIPQNRGEITNIVYYRKKLLTFTTQSLFQLLPNPQQLQTDVNTIYIGTGSFLAIPAEEMIESEWGHAGTSGRFNIKATPYGLFYQDIVQGKVYKFYDTLEDIGSNGLHNYFQSNRDFKLSKEYEELFNTDYPNEDNTLLESGIGLRSVYDPMYERVIFTKIDKKASYPLNSVEYCLEYPEYEIGFTYDKFPFDTTTIFAYDQNNLVVQPAGYYNYYYNSNPIVVPNGVNTFYTRTFPIINFFLTSVAYAGDSFPIEYASNNIDWTNPATKFTIYGSQFNSDSTYNYFTNGYESGVLNGVEPYQKWPNTVGLITQGSSGPAGFNDQLIGLFANPNSLIINANNIPISFQVPYEEALGFSYSFLSTGNLYTSPDISYKTNITVPTVSDKYITTPNGEVVKLECKVNYYNLPFRQDYLSNIWAKSRKQLIGSIVPETDVWNIASNISFIVEDYATIPSFFLNINNSTIIPLTATIDNSFPGFNFIQVDINENISLVKGDIIDIYIDNTDDNSSYVIDINSLSGSSSIFMTLTSTTKEIKDVECYFGTPDEIYQNGGYSAFLINGYPLNTSNANDKIPHLNDPLYWVPFYVFADDFNLTANIKSAIGATSGNILYDGMYEIYNTDVILDIGTSEGDGNYTITLEYDGNVIGNFVYDTVLSTNRGYDTFRLVLADISRITFTAGKPIPQIYATSLVDVGSGATSTYGAFTRISNATQEIKTAFCEGFLIKNYDTLASIAEAQISVYGADYVVKAEGNQERLLNYVIVEESGFYDVYITNDFDITQPNTEFIMYINNVQQLATYTPSNDGTSFKLSVKDITLTKGDIIYVVVKNVLHNTNVFTDQYLTTLVKKDYTCIEALPYDNISNTISYDVKNSQWASFHSYIPKLVFNDSKSYYTTEDLKNVYKHVDNNYLSYYNNLYPHIIEFVIAAPITYILNQISWIGDVQEYNEDYWIDVEEISFNEILVRNEKQSTGIQELNFNQSSIDWSNIKKKIIKKNREYRVGGIRNLATGQPLVTKANTNRSIDIVSNDNVIDTNRSLHLQDPLRSKYHIVRLYYNPTDSNKRVITNIVETLKQYSFG
jgi:hypothetical protein